MTLKEKNAQITREAAILSRARQDMRRIKSDMDARVWLATHYEPHTSNSALSGDLKAMWERIVGRVYGVGSA